VLYLDANVFIYAALNTGGIGDRARSILAEVQRGDLPAASSALSFDEIVWALKRYRGLEDAAEAGEAFLGMPNLRLVDVNGDLLSTALGMIRRHGLDPRDSIHAASALLEGAEVIVSTDEHFDRLTEIPRRDI
jgi:predicted nucleic acid-binding protein